MNTVVFGTRMSSYGYMTAASQTPDQPLCRGAERHHHGTGQDA
jgi:hypothetical protein